MQTGGLWKELQTAHSGVPTTIHAPRTALSTPSLSLSSQPLWNQCGPPSLSPRKPLQPSLVRPPSPPSFRLSLRYLYIGCPNFPRVGIELSTLFLASLPTRVLASVFA